MQTSAGAWWFGSLICRHRVVLVRVRTTIHQLRPDFGRRGASPDRSHAHDAAHDGRPAGPRHASDGTEYRARIPPPDRDSRRGDVRLHGQLRVGERRDAISRCRRSLLYSGRHDGNTRARSRLRRLGCAGQRLREQLLIRWRNRLRAHRRSRAAWRGGLRASDRRRWRYRQRFRRGHHSRRPGIPDSTIDPGVRRTDDGGGSRAGPAALPLWKRRHRRGDIPHDGPHWCRRRLHAHLLDG